MERRIFLRWPQDTNNRFKLEVDTGFKRTGVPYEEALQLAHQIHKIDHILFRGIYTFRGFFMNGKATRELEKAGLEEGKLMVELAERMRSEGIEVRDVSVDSTPTAIYAAQVKGVTEVRPGTYVFYERMQAVLDVCSLSECAATVRVTVVSRLLEEGMKAGSIGLSIGLLYAPGSYSSKEEIAELCSVLPRYHGLFSTHIRGEGNNLVPSIKEVVWIAKKSGVPLHVSHLKAAGKRNWGKVLEAMEIIADARAQGMDVTCDVYPYSARSTMLTTILPPWTLEGGIEQTLERFKDAMFRSKIKEELSHEQEDWDNLVCSTGWENVYISSVQSNHNRSLEGKHMIEISEQRGHHPVDCMLDLLLEEGGNVSIVYFLMSDDDVKQVMSWDKSLIASDSLHCETGKPHPRLYGSFPRVFAKFVREDRVLSLEEAVRKVTSFPVQRFKLGKRGLIVPSYAADLVMFDPETIQDLATFEDPKQYPKGISKVWVNGKITLEEGKHTLAREGAFISAQKCCWI